MRARWPVFLLAATLAAACEKRFNLVPLGDDLAPNPDAAFEVVAASCGPEGGMVPARCVLFSRRVRVRYLDGEVRQIRISLDAACRGTACARGRLRRGGAVLVEPRAEVVVQNDPVGVDHAAYREEALPRDRGLVLRAEVRAHTPDGEVRVGDAYDERFAPSWAHVAVAGWVFGHAVAWHPEDWSARVRRAIDAMRAAVVPGGRVVVETLGTGYETPVVAPALAPYFDLLGSEGFTRAWARSDYVFASASEAERLTRFFFGDAKGDHVRAAASPRVPECTGVWSCAV